MKILVDIRPLMDKKYSGVAEYTWRLLSALLNIDQANQYFLFCNSLHDISQRLPNFKQPNVKVIITRWPNKIFNYFFLWPFRRPHFDKLTKEKIDIFFMPHLHFVAWSKNVKSFLTIHDLSFLINKQWFSWRKNIWHKCVNVKTLVKRFNKIIAVSESTAQDLIALTKVESTKISIIYSGLDESFKLIDKSDPRLQAVRQKYNLIKPFILFLATIEPRKNVIGLIQAFELLKKKHQFQDLQLVLAGALGWKAKPIIKRLKDSIYKDDIILLNYIPAEVKPCLYNLAQVFAYPSFYEGFGFPPLEAMACGTPVVASANTSLVEIIGQAGILVEPYNPASLALALEQVLTDEQLAKTLITRGLEQVKKFSWEKTAREYLKLFEEMK